MSKTIFTLTMKSGTEMAQSVRKAWTVRPGTKVFKTKKDYDRQKAKLAVRRGED